MTAYYNENDPFAAAWLRELIKDNLIAPGEVDDRSIVDVVGADLRGFTQIHFFAGIGGWSYALRLAGWPDAHPVWTGSCPCQPFSAAGKRGGTADARHLWPEMRRLIGECRPAVVFGEQVASKDGRLWLSGVCADMEALGYGFGAADLCSAGVGAPHIRQRLYWMADAVSAGRTTRRAGSGDQSLTGCGEPGWVGNAHPARLQGRSEHAGEHPDQRSPWASGEPERLADAGHRPEHIGQQLAGTPRDGSSEAWQQRIRTNPWDGGVFIPCADGKARRVEPSIFPLAHGVPNRMGTLRGAGNAINPWITAEFIRAWLDTKAAT